MKVLVYSAKDFEIPFLTNANENRHQLTFLKEPLDADTAFKSIGHQAISIFSGDDASSLVLETLKNLEVKYISLRSTGYNNVHLQTAQKYNLRIANVPNYSPNAIAEHAVALLLALNRKIIRANHQVHRFNFLLDNLMGFDLNGKTIGIVGTGNIGSIMAKIMHGFGCNILGHDLVENPVLQQLYGVRYTDMKTLCSESDVISLHLPLDKSTYDIINADLINLMKENAILINTARGALVHTEALIEALKEGKIAAYGSDVYEREKGIFFRKNAEHEVKDEMLKRLLNLPSVLLTPHQAFMTKEALTNLAKTTIANIDDWEANGVCVNELWTETEVKGWG
nr:2-hydroxyacid dehydrogenase [Allomuricauda sp.]